LGLAISLFFAVFDDGDAELVEGLGVWEAGLLEPEVVGGDCFVGGDGGHGFEGLVDWWVEVFMRCITLNSLMAMTSL
jgi:hypothetical protein